MTERGVGGASGRDKFGSKIKECQAHQSTWCVGVGEDGFMPQR